MILRHSPSPPCKSLRCLCNFTSSMVIDLNVNSLYSAIYHTNGFITNQLSVIRTFTAAGSEEATVLQRDEVTERDWQEGNS